jgi:hypothetical protein
MSVRRDVALAVLVICLCACGTVSVHADWDQRHDFSGWQTFAWMPEGSGDPKSRRPVDNPLIEERVRDAIEHTLAAKGYRPTAGGAPDFYVGSAVYVEQKLDVYTINNYYGWGSRWGAGFPETRVAEYDEGELVIDLADAKVRKLVWRGSGSKRIDPKPSPERVTENVNRAVEEILKDFPPGRSD